jgi:hypothetical protein
MAVQDAFPLNGTYFQTNEVFLDEMTMQSPASVPWAVLLDLATKAAPCSGQDPQQQSPCGKLAWKTVHFGFSAASICRSMNFAEVAHTFHRTCICIRVMDCRSGKPQSLPSWLTPGSMKQSS